MSLNTSDKMSQKLWLSLFRWRIQRVIGTIPSIWIAVTLTTTYWSNTDGRMVLKLVWIFRNCKLRCIKKCVSVDYRGLPQKYWAVGLEGWAMPYLTQFNVWNCPKSNFIQYLIQYCLPKIQFKLSFNSK